MEAPESTIQRVKRESIESMLPANELIQSFDAQVWAREFVKCNLAYHIGLDEGALTTWFANALMRGWDEHRWRSKEYKRQIRNAMHPWWSWKRYFSPLSRYGR
jgi:hypothetical protein